MAGEPSNIRLFDIVLCVSRALDLLSPALSDHHHRVAYVAACVAEELELGAQDRREVTIAGALHDVGAVSLSTRLALLQLALPGHGHIDWSGVDVHRHGQDGYELLRGFAPFATAANAIRFHHVDWEGGRGREFAGTLVPLASHILRLADSVAILAGDGNDILTRAAEIRAEIVAGSGRLYREEVVEAFVLAARPESFWLDLVSPYKEEILRPYCGERDVALDADTLYALTRLLGKIVDFRSPFTVVHSANVATAAGLLADLAGLPVQEKRQLELAGYLHDIGKLAVPAEILDKPAALTPREMQVVRQHPYHTYRILSAVPGLEEVAFYGALHHERLDGSGYPFRTREVPFGSRVVAVADVFSALIEDRPYRAGMGWEAAVAVLDRMVAGAALDGDIVSMIRTHPDKFGQLLVNRAG